MRAAPTSRAARSRCRIRSPTNSARIVAAAGRRRERHRFAIPRPARRVRRPGRACAVSRRGHAQCRRAVPRRRAQDARRTSARKAERWPAIPLALHPDRLFPPDPATRELARRLYATVKDLPIVSPHGHTDPQWFADNLPFANASALFITPDHYVFRMLYSQGVPLEDLGIPRRDGGAVEQDARRIWRTFAERFHLFHGTPTRIWLDHAFATVFGIDERLDGRIGRPRLRPHQRLPRRARIPAARAVRALQHRGARHHRIAARSAGSPREDPGERMERLAS